MGRKHTHYSTEFRAEAVRLAETSGQSIRSVAMELGISNESLRRWIRLAHERPEGMPLEADERAELEAAAPAGEGPRDRAGDPAKSSRLLRSGDRADPVTRYPLRRAGEGEVSGADPLRGARSLPERLLRLALTRPVRAGTLGRDTGRGDPAVPCPEPRDVRRAPDLGRPRRCRAPRVSQASRTAHAGRPSRGRPSPPVRPHDDPRRGGRALSRPRQPRLHSHRSRSAVGRRHHPAPDALGTLLPRLDRRRLEPPGRRLVDGDPHAHRARHDRPGRGDRPPSTGHGSHPPLRPRVAVHEPGVRTQATRVRDRGVHGLGRRLLRQRHGRELLRHPGDRADRPPDWATPTEARAAVFDYIEVFYNRIRRHSSLGNLSPEQFEERYRSSPAAKAI